MERHHESYALSEEARSLIKNLLGYLTLIETLVFIWDFQLHNLFFGVPKRSLSFSSETETSARLLHPSVFISRPFPVSLQAGSTFLSGWASGPTFFLLAFSAFPHTQRFCSRRKYFLQIWMSTYGLFYCKWINREEYVCIYILLSGPFLNSKIGSDELVMSRWQVKLSRKIAILCISLSEPLLGWRRRVVNYFWKDKYN